MVERGRVRVGCERATGVRSETVAFDVVGKSCCRKT